MIGTLTRLGQSHRGYSQREKVVRFLLLRPGWHSIHAIHREVGFCRLNSRVAEARKVFRRDGHPFDIVHSIRDGEHGYELVELMSNPLEGGAASADAPMVASPSSGSNLSSQADPDSHGEDGSLTYGSGEGGAEGLCAKTGAQAGDSRERVISGQEVGLAAPGPFIHEGQETLL